MDELQQQLKAGLSAEVAAWSPTPSQVRRAAVPGRGRILAVAALVVLLVAGGIGTAIGLTGGAHRSPRATLGEAPPLPTAEDPSPSECPGASNGSYAPLASDGSAYSSSICLTFDTPGASAEPSVATVPGIVASATSAFTASPLSTVSPLISASPLPSVTPSPVVPTCPKSNFTVKVGTDQSSYTLKAPVRIAVSVTSKEACDTPNDFDISGAVRQGSSGGRVVEDVGGHCGFHDGFTPSCPAVAEPNKPTVKHWQAGETETAGDTWSQATAATSAGPIYAAPGDYYVVVTAGYLSGTAHFAITAPACTPDQLTVTLTADATSYAQGQVARFTGAVTNTSASVCEYSGSLDAPDPVASDSSGAKGLDRLPGHGRFAAAGRHLPQRPDVVGRKRGGHAGCDSRSTPGVHLGPRSDGVDRKGPEAGSGRDLHRLVVGPHRAGPRSRDSPGGCHSVTG